MPVDFKRILIVPVLAFCAVWGCAPALSREDLLKQMQDGRAPLIVDVRSRREFDHDHVPGAVSVPFYRIASGLRERRVQKQDRILLYCEHGPRAAVAGFRLILSGYEHTYTLEGHMKGWRENKFPLETAVP